VSIDFQQIYSKIREIGQGARIRDENLKRLRERAWDLLETHAADLDLLREKVERIARDIDPNLRCASPRTENLLSRQPAGPNPEAASLIAIDGSQVTPDRHEALTYGLVNVGAIVMRLDSGGAPEIFTESELLFDEELRNQDGSFLDESGIALKRDARERAKLLELARKFDPPVVALTDGPVELWGAKDPGNAASYQKLLQRYLIDLDKLDALGVTLGGYVDKPAADLVVRLLEVAIATDENLKELRTFHPLLGVTDRWLFSKLLHHGERSAVFAMQSSSRARYPGSKAIHFFYLNSGSSQHASIARVEIPGWVAEDEKKLALLHATLVQQSSLLGARPYPYILHRAHETALVSRDEKEQVALMLALELRKAGSEVEEPSNKGSAKNLSGRTG